MNGLFRSAVTGRLYEFVRWADDEDIPVVIGEGVIDHQTYRVPYKNIINFPALRAANETA